jgi:hypothetical protein
MRLAAGAVQNVTIVARPSGPTCRACVLASTIDGSAAPHFLGPQQTLTDEAILLGNRNGHGLTKQLRSFAKVQKWRFRLEFHSRIRARSGTKFGFDCGNGLSTYRVAAIGPLVDMAMIPDVPMRLNGVRLPMSGRRSCLGTTGLPASRM